MFPVCYKLEVLGITIALSWLFGTTLGLLYPQWQSYP